MIPVLSLIVLIAVIALSIVTKKNAGIIGLIAAYLFAVAAANQGVEINVAKIATGGWPMTVFFIVLSTTFLFGIANINGTTQVLSRNIICLARGNNKLLPLIFFVFGAIISGAGAGGLIVAVIMPIALFVAVQNRIPVMMMSLVTMGGIMVGGLSPLAINGIVAKQLALEQGMTDYGSMWLAYAVSMTIFSLAIYLIFGGLKAKNDTAAEKAEFTSFNKQQLMTLAAILAVLVGVIFFKQDIGLISFTCAGLLLLFNAADQKEAIASIPWATVILICGMAVLINVVKTVGGIDWLSDKLSNVMGPRSAQAIMVILGGLMGAVSSGTGVVMPTLIPLASQLAAQSAGTMSAMNLTIGVVVGTNGVVISPLSTVGGICVACAPEGVNRDKLYNQLLLAAVCFILLNAAASFIGLFNFLG
ncbi:MAG: SLC13 family permease [Peptococcaceae bacterium]|nr:SLC13 family permease [Peptococcaceae bacterium]